MRAVKYGVHQYNPTLFFQVFSTLEYLVFSNPTVGTCVRLRTWDRSDQIRSDPHVTISAFLQQYDVHNLLVIRYSSCRYNERQLIDITVVRRVRPRAERWCDCEGTAGGREPVGLFFAIDFVVHLLLRGTS